MVLHNDEYKYVKESKVLHISVNYMYLRRRTPFCSYTPNLNSQGYCASSRGSKYKQYVSMTQSLGHNTRYRKLCVQYENFE